MTTEHRYQFDLSDLSADLRSNVIGYTQEQDQARKKAELKVELLQLKLDKLTQEMVEQKRYYEYRLNYYFDTVERLEARIAELEAAS